MAEDIMDRNCVEISAENFQRRAMPVQSLECPGPADVHLWYLNLGLLAASLKLAPLAKELLKFAWLSWAFSNLV